MKNVAGFHLLDSQDCLGAAGSRTGLFSRLKGFGIRDFQNEVSAMRGTFDTARAVVRVVRRLYRVSRKDLRTPGDCSARFTTRRSMVAAYFLLW